MHHHPLRLQIPSPNVSFRSLIGRRTNPTKIGAVVLLTLSFAAASIGAQAVRSSLSYTNGYSVQTLRIEGDFVRYQYEEDNGKLQRAGQIRISDLDLADVTIGGGPDLFGVELRCKDGLECIGYSWIDSRVERGKPPVKGTNAVRSFPLTCRQKAVCDTFLAALKNNKGHPDNGTGDRRKPTADGPKAPEGDGLDRTSSPTLAAPSPQPKPVPPAPPIDDVNFSSALSTLGSLITFDNSTGPNENDMRSFGQTSADDVTNPRKRDVRDWLQSLARNMEDQTVAQTAVRRPVENLPDEFLHDRDLWTNGYRTVHAMNSQTRQTFADRFFDLFDLWDSDR